MISLNIDFISRILFLFSKILPPPPPQLSYQFTFGLNYLAQKIRHSWENDKKGCMGDICLKNLIISQITDLSKYDAHNHVLLKLNSYSTHIFKLPTNVSYDNNKLVEKQVTSIILSNVM